MISLWKWMLVPVAVFLLAIVLALGNCYQNEEAPVTVFLATLVTMAVWRRSISNSMAAKANSIQSQMSSGEQRTILLVVFGSMAIGLLIGLPMLVFLVFSPDMIGRNSGIVALVGFLVTHFVSTGTAKMLPADSETHVPVNTIVSRHHKT